MCLPNRCRSQHYDQSLLHLAQAAMSNCTTCGRHITETSTQPQGSVPNMNQTMFCPGTGYGAGIGFFFRNMAALTERFRVHAVDLLGTGMSGTGRTFWTRGRMLSGWTWLRSAASSDRLRLQPHNSVWSIPHIMHADGDHSSVTVLQAGRRSGRTTASMRRHSSWTRWRCGASAWASTRWCLSATAWCGLLT